MAKIFDAKFKSDPLSVQRQTAEPPVGNAVSFAEKTKISNSCCNSLPSPFNIYELFALSSKSSGC